MTDDLILDIDKVADEDMMRTMLCSLVVQQLIVMYLLPAGSTVNRLWLGWVLSFSLLRALHSHLTSPMSM